MGMYAYHNFPFHFQKKLNNFSSIMPLEWNYMHLVLGCLWICDSLCRKTLTLAITFHNWCAFSTNESLSNDIKVHFLMTLNFVLKAFVWDFVATWGIHISRTHLVQFSLELLFSCFVHQIVTSFSPERLYEFLWNLEVMKNSWSSTSIVLFCSDLPKNVWRAGQN